MTTASTTMDRAALAGLLTDADHSITGILTAEHPASAARAYLAPVLGPLSAGPGVVAGLAARLEALCAEPLPDSSASLFTMASYAAALGWLTESLVDLTTTVDLIPDLIDAVTAAQTGTQTADPDTSFPSLDGHFTDDELAALEAKADAAGLSLAAYVAAAGLAHAAAVNFRTDCTEIISGLREDAQYIQTHAPDVTVTGDGPDSLPTLVRSLLTRMETGE